jgi:hypothetical protein
MSLLKSLFSPRTTRVLTVAKEVAQRSCPAVWSRVQGRVVAMPAAEARGYIRAMCAAAIAHEIEAAYRRHRGLDRALLAQLSDASKDLLVEMLLSEVLRVQQTTYKRRRAA